MSTEAAGRVRDAASSTPEDSDEKNPKPKSGEEAKTARSMYAMRANNEATTAADVDDAKLASVIMLFVKSLLMN